MIGDDEYEEELEFGVDNITKHVDEVGCSCSTHLWT
jgi:hypothetical protein